jgi:CRISPR-associated protein Cmr3
LGKTNLVRMVLATPALFKQGWKPGWIGDDGKGEFAGIKLQLMGACVERWKPVSGWSYETPRGPKPALRLVPAGSVYFFQTEGNAPSLADHWLEPVGDFSEDGQSGRDGFGLALWGPWAPHLE